MAADEIARVVEQSSRKLFQISSPPVRYWLLTQVLKRREEDAVLQQTVEECAKYRPKMKLLSKLRPDGTWPIPKHKEFAEKAGPGPPIGWTFRTMLWNLFLLAEYRSSIREGYVNASLNKMLSWQRPEGYIPGPWTDCFPLPYFNGHALHLLIRFGMEKDARVKKLIKWELSMQRADGGWNIPFLMDVHYLPEYRGMRIRDFIEFIRTADKSKFDLEKFEDIPSCIWTTMLVVWGLAESEKLSRSRAVKKGAEFFLNRFFKRNYHSTYYMSESHWTRLNYPIHFGSGLMALDILTKLGYGPDDPRMEKPIGWLVGARSSDGMWSQSLRPHPERDQWITLYALRTLARYSRK